MSFILFPSIPLVGPGTITGPLTIASGTLTASAPALNITQTWNNAAVTFHSAVIDITKTAAVATSTMLDLRIAGVSKVSFEYDASNYPVLRVGTSATSGRITTYQVDCQQILPNEIQLGGYSDTVLRRFSAGKAVMRSGSTQQALLISNFYTDASNYEGLTLTGVAGTSVNITAETLGTGADNIDLVLTPAGSGSTIATGPLHAGSLVTGGGAANANGFTVSYYAPGIRMSSICGLNWATTSPSSGADAGLCRNAAGVVEVNNGTAGTWRDLKLRNLINNPSTFAGLTAAATAGAGARAFINDGAANVYGVAAAGGGALKIPVYSDGANWIVG